MNDFSQSWIRPQPAGIHHFADLYFDYLSIFVPCKIFLPRPTCVLRLPTRHLIEDTSGVKSSANFCIVLVTAPDVRTARKLAKSALSARLVGCANLLPKIESHYCWQGKIESSAEVLIVFKTRRTRLAALEKLVLREHPYETPEFLNLPVSGGTEKYLAWLGKNC